MQIPGSPLNPYQLPAPKQGSGARTSGEQRYVQEQAATQSRATGNERQGRVTQERPVQGTKQTDYTEVLRQSRGSTTERFRNVTPPATESLSARRAVDAYQSTANDPEGMGIELMPRVDSYA